MRAFFAVLFCLVTLNANAATEEASASRAQLPTASASPVWMKVMPTIGIASMRMSQNTRMDLGPSVGALVEMGNGPLTFETGLLFNQFGGVHGGNGRDNRVTLNFLSTEAVGKYAFNVNSTKYHVKAGLMPSLFISSEYTSGSNRSSYFKPGNETDFMGILGFGGAGRITAENELGFDLAYVRTLATLPESSRDTYTSEGLIASMSLSFDML